MRAADIHDFRTVGSVTLRPGSDTAVYTITWPDLESDSNRSQIHLYDDDGDRQLTHGHSDTSPRFSPSGARLAFLRSEPESKPNLMVLDWGPGEPVPVGDFPDGVTEARWIDEQRLAVLATARPENQIGLDDDEVARLPRTINSLNYRFNDRGWTHDRLRQIYILDLESGRQHRISDPSLDHSSLVVDSTGDWIATVAASDDDSDLTGVNHIWVSRTDGTEPVKVTRCAGSWDGLCWHHEGPLVATGSPVASEIGFSLLYRFDRSSDHVWSEPTRLSTTDTNIDTFGSGVPIAVSGAILAPVNTRGATVIERFPLDGSTSQRFHDDLSLVGSFDATVDCERVVAAITTPTRPADLWDLSDSDPSRLTSFNDQLLAELDLCSPESVEVRSEDGTAVQAWIHRPPRSAPRRGETGPGLLYVHGGPMAQYGYGFFDEFQLAAADGYTVMAGNPRGSDGYGEKWATHIVGHLGEHDWQDVSAMADHLCALSEVDDNRVGIGGGSYGGFMAAWAIGHTDRFKAALVERAVTNWETFSGTTDIPYFVALYMGTTIEADVEALRRQSPINYAAGATTSTMILHSEEDWRCPIEQAEQLFATLRRNGCPVTMVRFPSENHELSRGGSPRHRIERFEIIHDFFRDHLG